MRVAIYARVSTQHQAQAQTIEQQLERLTTYAQRQGWALPGERIFRDDGYSGSTLCRPGLDRLRDLAAAGELERVVITDPDRLARNYVHQMVLLEEFEQHGCQVEFLERPLSRDPHEQLVLQIRGAVAEYERTLIAERMRRGRQARYRAGVLLPWTRPPYGHQVDPDRPRDPAGVQVDQVQATVVREMFTFYLQEGSTLFGLVKHLHTLGVASPTGQAYWNPATVRGILTNPAYTGQVYAGRTRSVKPRIRRSATHPLGQAASSRVPTPAAEWVPVATIPVIIDQEQFDRVRAKLAHNQQGASRNNTAHSYLLRALVSCGVCQLSCTARQLNPGYDYYVCRSKTDAVCAHLHHRCPARYIPARQLDELVWQDLCEMLTHPEIVTQALHRAQGGSWLPQELQARRENLRRGQVALQNQLDRLTDAYLNGIIPLPEYQRRRADLEQKRQGLEEQAQQIGQQANRQEELAHLCTSVEGFCGRVQTGLVYATFEQKRKLVELLVDRVVVTDGDVEIRYVVPTNPSSEHVRFCHLRKDYFHRPAPLIILQGLLHGQVSVGADKELRAGVARVPLGDDATHLVRHLFQVAIHRTHVVGARWAGRVERLQRDTLIALVPKRLVVVVHAFAVEPPVGLDGTDDMPALPPTELDQFGRRVPGVEQHVHLVALGQQSGQFDQHLPSQGILAAEMQTTFYWPLAVELPDGLLSQVELRVEQEADGSDLDVDFDVHVAVAVDLLLAGAVRVVVMKADGFQVTSVFVFLAQTVVHADQDDRSQVQLAGQLQELEQHPAFARSADVDDLPGTLSEKVGSRFGVAMASQLAVQIGQRFARVTDQQGIHELGQVPNLRL